VISAAESAGDGGVPSSAVKWGKDCLSVIPDAWLEEEMNRRASQRTQMNDMTTTNSIKSASIQQGEGGGVVSGIESGVQLCGTGKCEMFD